MARATVEILNIVIASPGDVPEERNLVEQVIAEINRHFANDRNLRLETARWEIDSYPGFHLDGPQGIIDTVLKIEDADILVGIFWTRFGTPGPDGKTGTEHEIDKAITAWNDKGSPQPMIYFRTEPFYPKDTEALGQFGQVLQYKEKLSAQSGFYWPYENSGKFKDELRGTLENYLADKYPLRPGVKPQPSADSPTPTAFLRTYRTRLAHLFETWDTTNLGVRLAGAERPDTVKLDDIYLTLRLAKSYDIRELEKGEPLTPENLLARERPLLIRGPAGAGKTTWMKRTFRALLSCDALPIFLELRGLAKDWRDHGERTFDDALVKCVAKECPGDGLLEAVKAKRGPRAVLLIDGWDELGELGRRVRHKLLGFLKEHKRVLAVVSSRPYGTDVPSENAGFEELDLQPLNDGEIRSFAQTFHHLCYGEETAKVAEKAEEFLDALKNSHGAEDLARTPLLLTMMLGLSRTRPLPDKRHQLYEECVKALLAERPKRYQQEGVQFDDWYPPDDEERLRITASLAFQLQESSGRHWDGPIVGGWQQMASFLPGDWGTGQKTGFLSWLAGPASLLNERTDHTLAFTHLSFQEFLAAWNRSRVLEGDDRTTFATEKAATTQWWETLRLWAALVEGQQGRETLETVLDKLLESDAGSALAGAMLADGLGSELFFERWAGDFAVRVRTEYFSAARTSANAWAASRQKDRREAIPGLWSEPAAQAGWLAWLRLDRWREDAKLPESPARPPRETHAGRFLACLDDGPESEADFAAGRILCGADPAWPGEPWAVALLHAWPGHRRLAALRLQSLITVGAGHALPVIAREVLAQTARSEQSEQSEERERDLARDWVRNWARDWVLDWARDWARYLARDLARDLARYLALDWARDWAKKVELDPAKPAQLDFALWETGSFGRSAARARLAIFASERGEKPLPPAVHLFSAASRLSLRPDSPADEFELALDAYGASEETDPLWPALARHLVRRSTPEDKALLEDLARHPEKREPPLSWGLQYIVRGDILLEDGSVVTVDELCEQYKLPRLPYLEDLPPELEIDWEEDKPGKRRTRPRKKAARGTN